MIRKLCHVSQLPEEGLLRAFVGDHSAPPLALCVGVLGGVPYVVDNVCPHQRAPLAAGRLEGEYVVCPLHEWRWSLIDGSAAHAADPSILSYEARRYDDEIFVRIPEQGTAFGAPSGCGSGEIDEKSDCKPFSRSAIR